MYKTMWNSTALCVILMCRISARRLQADHHNALREKKNMEQLLDIALEMGFANAALIDTKDIVFNPAFRPLCEENLCGKYGVNYACPPDCGTTEQI